MHLNLIVLSSVVKGYGRRWLWSEQHYTMYWQALGDLVGGRGVIKISMTGELLYKLLYVLVGIPSKGGGFICVTPPPPDGLHSLTAFFNSANIWALWCWSLVASPRVLSILRRFALCCSSAIVGVWVFEIVGNGHWQKCCGSTGGGLESLACDRVIGSVTRKN